MSGDSEKRSASGAVRPLTPGPYDDVARDAPTVDDALVTLHHLQASPTAAIRSLITGRGMSLKDAKAALHSSSAWAQEARAAESSHKVMAAAWDAIELQQLESELAGAILRHERDPRELLERLVDALLVGSLGQESLNTDGLEVSREFNRTDGYLAVGHMWMLPNRRDQVCEPVYVHLAFSEDGASVLAGAVHFGLSPHRPTAPAISHQRAIKLLLADPEEAPQRIPWAYTFERTPNGWRVAGFRGAGTSATPNSAWT